VLTANALIKGGGAGAAPVASTATVDASGNLTAAAVTVSGSTNQTLLSNGIYTFLCSPDGSTTGGAIAAGSSASPYNLYQNTNHHIQSRDGTVNFGIFDSSGLTVTGLLTVTGNFAVTGRAALPQTDFGTSFATRKGFVDGTSGNASFDGTLTIGGAMTVAGNLTINGNIYPGTTNALSCGIPAQGWFQVASANFVNLSGAAEKQDVEAVSPVLDRVLALTPKTYRWRDGPDTERRHHGFIAEDVRDVLGEGFGGYHTDENGGQGLAYHELTAVLWRAVQELSARVTALEARGAPGGG
jgi:hypothetical protein